MYFNLLHFFICDLHPLFSTDVYFIIRLCFVFHIKTDSQSTRDPRQARVPPTQSFPKRTAGSAAELEASFHKMNEKRISCEQILRSSNAFAGGLAGTILPADPRRMDAHRRPCPAEPRHSRRWHHRTCRVGAAYRWRRRERTRDSSPAFSVALVSVAPRLTWQHSE